MKSAFLSIFILIITLGICEAQTVATTTTVGKSNARAVAITQNLTQELVLSPAQATQVQTIFQQSIDQIHQVVQTNQGNKVQANDQMQTLIQQRDASLQNVLTAQQFVLYKSGHAK